MAARCQFENSNDVGVFANLTNSYCLVALGAAENFYRCAPLPRTPRPWPCRPGAHPLPDAACARGRAAPVSAHPALTPTLFLGAQRVRGRAVGPHPRHQVLHRRHAPDWSHDVRCAPKAPFFSPLVASELSPLSPRSSSLKCITFALMAPGLADASTPCGGLGSQETAMGSSSPTRPPTKVISQEAPQRFALVSMP